jgi:hypothetical protein
VVACRRGLLHGPQTCGISVAVGSGVAGGEALHCLGEALHCLLHRASRANSVRGETTIAEAKQGETLSPILASSFAYSFRPPPACRIKGTLSLPVFRMSEPLVGSTALQSSMFSRHRPPRWQPSMQPRPAPPQAPAHSAGDRRRNPPARSRNARLPPHGVRAWLWAPWVPYGGGPANSCAHGGLEGSHLHVPAV